MSTPMVWIFPRCGFFWLREVFLIWKVALGADKFTPSVWFFSQQCTALDWKYAFFYLGQTVSHKGVNLFTTVISSSLKVCTFVGGYDDTIPGCSQLFFFLTDHNYERLWIGIMQMRSWVWWFHTRDVIFFSQLWWALDWNSTFCWWAHLRCENFFISNLYTQQIWIILYLYYELSLSIFCAVILLIKKLIQLKN